jgi:outer membrane protein OmpA-like peptidoglycan-associated protein
LLIALALVISALVFFFYTKKKMESSNEAAAATVTKAPASAPAPAKPAPAAVAVTPPVVAEIKPVMTPAATPSEIGTQLAQALTKGDMTGAAKILGGSDVAQQAAVKELLETMVTKLGYKIAAPDQIKVLGQVGSSTRLSIPLLDPKTGKMLAEGLTLDIQRDGAAGWKVAQVNVPKELEAAIATAPVAAAGSAPAAKPFIVVQKNPDSLLFAGSFVQSLLKLDFEAVRKQVDEERVPAMKIAGLCIAFEEGQYRLQEQKPIVATVSTDKVSWVIAKIHSDILKEDSEFGLEMETQDGKGWRVVGLNLSKLLADNAKSSALVGIPYTPLVMNPKGGESIALYYEYDQSELHPRAKKQLEIVANILKASKEKKLKIGGHTDALGSDDYNVNLSKKRAEAVKAFMIATGVPLGQVETVGFGKTNPLSPNVNPDGSDNPDGRSRNRRAEILLDF